MTPTDFRAWRKSLHLSQAAAAIALGLGKRTVEKYEAGELPVPKPVRLACAALTAGISDWSAAA